MKAISLRYLFFLLLSLPIISACGDDDIIADPVKTKTDLLIEQTWQGEAVIALDTDISANQQFLTTFPDIKTMTLNFDDDGTYTANYSRNGAVIKTEGEWEFRNNESVLYLDLEQLKNYVLTIDQLTDERLELTTNIQFNTLMVPAEVQFSAQ